MLGERYLYGAAVQGIQSFIFQTNELKDIVGASELVDNICTDAFESYCDEKGTSILRAAGNIKYIFTDRQKCEKAVREFPKKVMTMAPGITISQAVVKIEGENFSKAVNKLEERLRIQRNRPMQSLTIGLTGVLRSRKTGLPAIIKDKQDYLDSATVAKRKNKDTMKRLCEKSFGIGEIKKERIALDINDITKKNDWIAVIHADGNGLGNIVQAIGDKEENLRTFSENLDKATITAANKAFESVKESFKDDKIDKDDKIPIRPIVLGGDDMTVICRADIAIEYTSSFLKEFENQTNEYLKDNPKHENLNFDRLTACAGIAFIKSSYPFYYGYNLAEMLCERAKKKAREINEKLAPSCLMFHKVQDSFIEDFDIIAKRELTAQNNISFEFGPYYLDKQTDSWTIDQLIKITKELNSAEGNIVKSNLRQWLSLLCSNEEMAKQKIERMKSLMSENELSNFSINELTNTEHKKVPAYDILALHSILFQETK